MATPAQPAPTPAPPPPTTTPTPAPTPDATPAPTVAPRAAPPASDYVTVWVHHTGVAAVQNRTGWVQLLRTDADALIAAGHAVNPYTVGTLPYITAAPAPTPAPSPAPTPAPSPTPAPPPPAPLAARTPARSGRP